MQPEGSSRAVDQEGSGQVEEASFGRGDPEQAAGVSVDLGRGKPVAEVCRLPGVTEPTYDRWWKEYGGLKTDQAKKLKELEKENARLKLPLADTELYQAILREAALGNW